MHLFHSFLCFFYMNVLFFLSLQIFNVANIAKVITLIYIALFVIMSGTTAL